MLWQPSSAVEQLWQRPLVNKLFPFSLQNPTIEMGFTQAIVLLAAKRPVELKVGCNVSWRREGLVAVALRCGLPHFSNTVKGVKLPSPAVKSQ